MQHIILLSMHLIFFVGLIQSMNTNTANVEDLRSEPDKLQRYCGEQIANIISAVCNGSYATDFRIRRSVEDYSENKDVMSESNSEIGKDAITNDGIAKDVLTKDDLSRDEARNKMEYSTNDDLQKEEDEVIRRFTSRLAARRFMVRSRRARRGVVEECCIKSCSYNELLTYCGDKVVIINSKYF